MARGHIVKIGEDWVDGFGVGREASMRDYSFRKEQREFKELVAKLSIRRWQKRNPERLRAARRRWRQRHPEKNNANTLRAKRKARLSPEYREAENAKNRARRARARAAEVSCAE